MDFRSDVVLRGIAWDKTITSLKNIFSSRPNYNVYLISMAIGIMYDKRIAINWYCENTTEEE